MISYHNDPSLKSRLLAHVERHRQQDSLLRGTYGTMDGELFRGCAVGCSIRSLDEIEGKPLKLQNGSHADLAKRLDIPLVLAHLQDRIFEGLPLVESKLWPTLFYRAIPVGADLSLVWPRFAHWMLVDEAAGVIRCAKTQQARDAITGVAALFARQANGESVTLTEWRTARSASASASAAAAASAFAAAASASASAASASASAAFAAAASAFAADASASAFASAADADASARSRHFKLMAEALLRFMAEAPAALPAPPGGGK